MSQQRRAGARGRVAEYIVAAHFMQTGHDVLWPANPTARHDLFISGSRVQVKAVTNKHCRLKLNYTDDDIDELAVVNLDTWEIWLIPFSQIDGLKTMLITDKLDYWKVRGVG